MQVAVAGHRGELDGPSQVDLCQPSDVRGPDRRAVPCWQESPLDPQERLEVALLNRLRQLDGSTEEWQAVRSGSSHRLGDGVERCVELWL